MAAPSDRDALAAALYQRMVVQTLGQNINDQTYFEELAHLAYVRTDAFLRVRERLRTSPRIPVWRRDFGKDDGA